MPVHLNANHHDPHPQLRKVRPEIEVLFTSGYNANTSVHDRGLHSNVVFLQKPFFSSVLANKVREALDGFGGCEK